MPEPTEDTPVVIPDYWDERGRANAQAAAARAGLVEQQGEMAASMATPEELQAATPEPPEAPATPAPIPIAKLPFVDPNGNPVDDQGIPVETN